MRMAELSRRSGVPIATIKYYRREGLLPPGEPSAPNQAEYAQSHLDRLRLIRTLREVADLAVAGLRDVVAAIEDPGRSPHDVVGAAHRAIDARADMDVDADALARADAVVGRAGWRVGESAPARATLARALAALDDLGISTDEQTIQRYVDAADTVAAAEVESTMGRQEVPSRDALVTSVVAGTVLYEQVLTAMRRLAQEHHSASRRSRPGPSAGITD